MKSNAQDGRSARAQAQREAKRQQILDAAVSVFTAQGYHHTQISDVVQKAGVARGTFYHYFSSKNAIFLELLGDLTTQLRNSVVGVDVNDLDHSIHEQLRHSLANVLETVASNEALTKIIFQEAVGLDQEINATLKGFYERLHAYLVATVENGQKLGFLRASTPPALTATFILGAVKQTLEYYTEMPAETRPARTEVADELIRFHLHGILAQ